MIDTSVSVYRTSLLTGLHSHRTLVRYCPGICAGVCVRFVTSFRLEETVSGVMTLAVWEISPVLSADESGVSWAGCEDRSARRWRRFRRNPAPCGVLMMYDLGVTHSLGLGMCTS